MKVRNMPTNELYPGLMLYEDIYSNLGAVILAKDTVLEKHHIEKLMINGIERVRVVEKEDTISEDYYIPEIKSIFDKNKIGSFRHKYSEKVDEITHIIKQVSRGSCVNINQINNISKHIIHEFNTLSDVINYMHLARPQDDYTYSHSLNVSLLAIIIAKWLGLNEKQVDEIAIAGLLHDIGKTKVPEHILSKPGKLTDEEFEEVKKHTIYGYRLIENVADISPEIKQAVLMHHEKIDGSGYPTGAKEAQIPLFAKIIAVADIYDAMTSTRAYRDRLCPFEVIKDFEMQNYGKLDTKVLSVFLKNIANSYKGDFVELNTGEIGEIVFINPNRVWQPIVRCGSEYIDLSKENYKDYYIKQII